MRFITALLITIVLASGCVAQQDSRPDLTADYVEKVIDGDTLEMHSGERIRLLGIDTPERGEFLYEEASDRLSELVLGKYVRLESDAVERDAYGRLLRYIFINNTLVNYVLVKEGYAEIYLPQEGTKYEKRLIEAEDYAMQNRLGIWSGN